MTLRNLFSLILYCYSLFILTVCKLSNKPGQQNLPPEKRAQFLHVLNHYVHAIRDLRDPF